MPTAVYNSGFFNVRNIAEAKAVILTPEDSTTDKRWLKETPYLGELIDRELDLLPRHRVLDYGCGIGRLSKELIARAGCSVVGMDADVSMRCLAPGYVLSDRFCSCPASMLESFNGFHHVVASWVLQHIPDLERSVQLIHQHLRSFGKVMVVNQYTRAIPIDGGQWYDDKKDVREHMCARFREIQFGELDAERTTELTAKSAYWAVYQKRS